METHAPSHKRHATAAECCGDACCDSGQRNRYFAGKRMTPESLKVEQRYHLERRRLINRAVHGWGVVYGFGLRVSDPDDCGGDGERRLRIGAGLAFDACGRELVQASAIKFRLEDIVAIGDDGCFVRDDGKCRERNAPTPWDGPENDIWLLSAHYAERLLSPLTLKDPCHCDGQEWDHVCETIVYSLQRTDRDGCCAKNPCTLACDCPDSPCCRLHDDKRGLAEPASRGGCRCLCEHLTGLDVDPCDCDTLCEVKRGLRASPGHGVALACVRLAHDRCGDWTIAQIIDDCGPRRLVKRNDLLFDLIRGCDLTRIVHVGWEDWHRGETSYEKFRDSFGKPDDADNTCITELYTVRFSGPVRRSTVQPDCFVMTIVGHDEEGGWGMPHRVPIVRVDAEPEGPDDPKGTCRDVRLVVEADWFNDAICSRKSIFHHHAALVEIEIRGDYILDCNGQAVDANAIGRQPTPTGNGVPGDSYVSNFRVAARVDDRSKPSATTPSVATPTGEPT